MVKTLSPERTILVSREPRAESLFRVGENCCHVEHAQRVAFIVDGDAYFSAFRRAAEAAEHSILLVCWDFDSSTLLDPRDSASAVGRFLNEIVRRKRGLKVRILDWDYPLVFGTDRELSPARGLSSWKPHRRVHFRYDNTHPVIGSQHQKIAVFDDKVAFVGGLDITCKRWDTPEHAPDNPYRVSSGKPYPPFHDLMIAVDGDAARALAGIVRTRWQGATGECVAAVEETSGDPWPAELEPHVRDVGVAIACTAPDTANGTGVRHIESLYLDMIAAARRYIYIENQYFTSHLLGDALAQRLAEPDGPEIVLVTRLLSHGWLEEVTMHVLRTRLIQRLREADVHDRFRVYYPHIGGLAEGTCVDVHSKMMAVDDEWLRIGSSNLSNRSMGLDTECDVVVEARGQARVARAIRAFRDRLLGEHLDTAPAEVALAVREAGSMRAAIAKLGSENRSLRELEELKQWPQPIVEAIAITDPERPVLDQLFGDAGSAAQRQRPSVLPKVAAFAALLIGLALAWRFTPLADWLTVENVTRWSQDFGSRWWAPFAVVLAYTPASFLLIPRPLITLAATLAFGAWLGFAYGMLGIVIAGVVTYAVGRLMRRETVERIAGPRLTRVSEMLRKRGLPAVIAVRFVPVAPFSVVNMVAGAIRIKLWHFVVGTTVGILPGVLTATVFGDQFGSALEDPGGINYWLIAGIALFFVVAILLVRRWVKRMTPAEKPASKRPAPATPRNRRKFANVT